MDYKIVTSSSPSGLTTEVKKLINEGWKPIGGHTAVEIQHQNRYAGTQHMDTIVKTEYSQSMIKEE